MRIIDLVTKNGSAGSNQSWKSHHWEHDGFQRHQIWHHSHLMISWFDGPNGPDVLTMSVGWGSVSDQGGMNQIFRALRLPYYFSRKGGAEILTIVGTTNNGKVTP